MIRMRQLVEGEVRHPPRFGLEDPHVRELDPFLHRRVTLILPQPVGTRVVLGPGRDPGILGRDPQRDLAQLGHRPRGHHPHHLLKLLLQQFQRLLGLAGRFFQQLPAHLDGPARQLSVLAFGHGSGLIGRPQAGSA